VVLPRQHLCSQEAGMNRRFALDGVRGYAAIATVIYHAILAYNGSFLINSVLTVPIQSIPADYDRVVKSFLIIFNGQTAVLIFFILSGLVLSNSLGRSPGRNSLVLSLEFTFKRLARIYPTLIVSLVLFWASRVLLNRINPEMFTSFSLHDLANNALLRKITMNRATWTLQVEILAIPFILLCFFIRKRFGVKGLLPILFYLILMADNPLIQIPWLPFWLSGNLAAFVCGFMISSKEAEQFFMMFGISPWFSALILAALLLVRHVTPFSSSSGAIFQLLFASMLIGSIYYRLSEPMGKILESKISVYLGKISYSFYLNNVMFLNIFIPLFSVYFYTGKNYLEIGLLTALLSIILAIFLSHITEKYVERPSIQAGNFAARWLSAAENKWFSAPRGELEENQPG
jgi:peptidoglycan/LPS O-acetylase OafA/YrhL